MCVCVYAFVNACVCVLCSVTLSNLFSDGSPLSLVRHLFKSSIQCHHFEEFVQVKRVSVNIGHFESNSLKIAKARTHNMKWD